jgi:hypothetical protein
MKKITAIVMLVAAGLFLSCESKLKESQVPAPVRAAFEKQHPGTKGKWEKEEGNYEVSFDKDGKEQSLVINETGTILETEYSIPVTELPAPVAGYIKDHYNGAEIKDAAKITNNKGEIMYEAAIKGKDVIFDANGNYLKEAKD